MDTVYWLVITNKQGTGAFWRQCLGTYCTVADTPARRQMARDRRWDAVIVTADDMMGQEINAALTDANLMAHKNPLLIVYLDKRIPADNPAYQALTENHLTIIPFTSPHACVADQVTATGKLRDEAKRKWAEIENMVILDALSSPSLTWEAISELLEAIQRSKFLGLERKAELTERCHRLRCDWASRRRPENESEKRRLNQVVREYEQAVGPARVREWFLELGRDWLFGAEPGVKES